MTVLQGKRQVREAGFTLLELLMVLSIMAAVLAVAVPMVGLPKRGMALKANALALAVQMRTLRAAAVDRNLEQAMVVDLKKKRFWVAGNGRVKGISSQLSLSALTRPQDVVGPSAVRFRFHPDGTASRGTLIIREGARSARIAIDWRTGAPRIAWSR